MTTTTINRHLARASAALTLMLLVLLLPAVAHASTDADSIGDLARLIYDGVMSGQYFAAAAGALVLATAMLRRYGAQLLPWFASDAGGTVLTLTGSLGGALLTAAVGGAAVSWSLVWAALIVGFVAIGGYKTIKRLVIDPLRPRAANWPIWGRAAFSVVAWIFDRPETSSTRAVTTS